MTEYGFCVRALYSDVTDQELYSLVSTIKKDFPNSGYRLTQGHLLCQRYRISQIRIKESMHQVDPEGTTNRWTSAVQRSKYTVSSPLSLAHRWKS